MQRESTTVIILGRGYLRFSPLSSDKISELFTINTSLHLENYKQSLASTPNGCKDPSGEDWVTRSRSENWALSAIQLDFLKNLEKNFPRLVVPFPKNLWEVDL